MWVAKNQLTWNPFQLSAIGKNELVTWHFALPFFLPSKAHRDHLLLPPQNHVISTKLVLKLKSAPTYPEYLQSWLAEAAAGTTGSRRTARGHLQAASSGLHENCLRRIVEKPEICELTAQCAAANPEFCPVLSSSQHSTHSSLSSGTMIFSKGIPRRNRSVTR
jgi:hypothetical protein